MTLTLTIDIDSDYRGVENCCPLSVVRCLLSLKFFNKSFYHIVCAIVDVF